ncbi:MAG: helix-turn-helix transcriptional regulator [Lachnospiraceae bacterium]|nr:helix-turn-helix transcriptional regulator [Lachnospiraceae bacterium]
MDIIKRIEDLVRERGWSDYRLAAESGLSASTIANMHRRNTIPSIATLEAICRAFGITVSQFFEDDLDIVHLDKDQKELFMKWKGLTDSQKQLIMALIQELK